MNKYIKLKAKPYKTIGIFLLLILLTISACKKKQDPQIEGGDDILINNLDHGLETEEDDLGSNLIEDEYKDETHEDETEEEADELELDELEENGIYFDEESGFMIYEDIIYSIKEASMEAVIYDYQEILNDNLIIPETINYGDRSYTVTGIDEMALFSAEMTSLVLPDTITYIAEGAFYSCEKLTSITLPSSIKSIEAWTFYGCTLLEGVILPEGIEFIGEEAFYGCESLTSIVLPDGITIIEDYVFGECYNLTKAKLPAGLEKLPNYMFSNCRTLEEAELPNNLKAIGTGAFEECTSLKEITLSEGLVEIEYDAFYYCGLAGIRLPRSLETDDDSMFSYCENLQYVEVPEEMYSYYEELFEYEAFQIEAYE